MPGEGVSYLLQRHAPALPASALGLARIVSRGVWDRHLSPPTLAEPTHTTTQYFTISTQLCIQHSYPFGISNSCVCTDVRVVIAVLVHATMTFVVRSSVMNHFTSAKAGSSWRDGAWRVGVFQPPSTYTRVPRHTELHGTRLTLHSVQQRPQ